MLLAEIQFQLFNKRDPTLQTLVGVLTIVEPTTD